MGYCSRCGEISPNGKCRKCGGRSVASIATGLGVEAIALADKWQSQYATSILGTEDPASSETVTAPSVLDRGAAILSKTCITCHKILLAQTENNVPYCKDCQPSMNKGTCAACFRPIFSSDLHVEHTSRFWHKTCFQCHQCQRSLGDTPMVDLKGRPCCDSCLMAQSGSAKTTSERAYYSPSQRASTGYKPTPSSSPSTLMSAKHRSFPPTAHSTLLPTHPPTPTHNIHTIHYHNNSHSTYTASPENNSISSQHRSSFTGITPAKSSSSLAHHASYPASTLKTRSSTTTKPFDSISSLSTTSSSSSSSSNASNASSLSSASSWTSRPIKSLRPRIDFSQFKHDTTKEQIHHSSLDSMKEARKYQEPSPSFSPSPQKTAPLQAKENQALADYRRSKAISEATTSYTSSNPYYTPPKDPSVPDCTACRLPLKDERVQLPASLGSVWYHPDCLVCDGCHGHFTSSMFMSDGKRIYHPKCLPIQNTHTPPTASSSSSSDYTCYGCNKRITGKCLTNSSRYYHPECFDCYSCHTQLPIGQPFYEIQGEAYCDACSQHPHTVPTKERSHPPSLSSMSSSMSSPMSSSLSPSSLSSSSLSPSQDTPRFTSRSQPKLGGSKVCPYCQLSVSIMDETPGPRATRWHKKCLKCKDCQKQLDSAATVVEGRLGEWTVWCRTCRH
ncbi:hypothetical protein BDF14DRAFT_1857427 [Spinellus fusiger]|nr:hypothetical protein BDF14DRAFT_1857427 [Spinellus fusiger]